VSAESHRLRNLLLLLLSAAAGCTDAIAFIHAGVFPANMTGNTVVLAINLFSGSSAALLSALALVGFCGGAVAGAWLVHSTDRAWSRRTNTAILCGATLVGAATAAIFLYGDRVVIPVVLATSAAMGLQSAAVQHLGLSGVATVFMTGTLTTAVSRFTGAALDRAPSSSGAALPALTWLGYFAGALVGGLHRTLHTDIPFALPTMLLLGVAILAAPLPKAP
jgi:uncharacterized membrane protein YoaK (UPF0700 family)